MDEILLILNTNRILLLYNLKELSISYYPKYGLYALYYCDDSVSKRLIYSSDNFWELFMIEKKIKKACNDNISVLRI